MPTQTAAAPVADRIAALDWAALDRAARRAAASPDAAGPRRRGVRGARRAVRRRPLPLARRHGAATASARASTSTSTTPLPALVDECAARPYPPLAAIANDWAAAARGGGVAIRPSSTSSSRAATRAGQTRPTPLHPALRRRRLQLPAPGPLRRARVPAAGRDGAEPRGDRLRGRRVRARRAAARGRSRAAHVIELERGAFAIFPTRTRPVEGARGHYRDDDAPRRRDGPRRGADHARDHLPRRGLTRTLCKASFAKR